MDAIYEFTILTIANAGGAADVSAESPLPGMRLGTGSIHQGTQNAGN
jgi:hypothetical protein